MSLVELFLINTLPIVIRFLSGPRFDVAFSAHGFIVNMLLMIMMMVMIVIDAKENLNNIFGCPKNYCSIKFAASVCNTGLL